MVMSEKMEVWSVTDGRPSSLCADDPISMVSMSFPPPPEEVDAIPADELLLEDPSATYCERGLIPTAYGDGESMKSYGQGEAL